MRPRTIGRRLALQYLFMVDMNRYEGVETPAEFFQTQRRAVLDGEGEGASDAGTGGFVFDRDDPHQDEAEFFALQIINEVKAHRDVIDAEIARAAKNWSLARMGVIERNVIRMAAAELRLGETPRSVVMNEAVKLAKRFGTKDSGAFVNGIADKLVAESGASGGS